MTIDVTQILNFSAAVRKAEPDWDDDKIEPSDLIVLNKYMYRFINSIEVQP